MQATQLITLQLIALDVGSIRAEGTHLTLRPGVASEMLVRLQNQSDRPLQLTFYLDGDFPMDWCQFGSEGTELLPGQRQEAVLRFSVPANFFEQPLSAETLPIQQDYHGQLMLVATETQSSRQQTEHHSFKLFVRPHSLYPRFLPGIYRDVDFIERFLKIFEEAFEPTVNTLDNLWAYLDPLTAPEAMLPFLAHWVGWDFQGFLTLQQQRVLIRYALQIYRWRGTRRGLRFYLHLATGLPLDEHLEEDQKSISIQESFSQGCVLDVAKLGEDAVLGKSRPLHFSINLRSEAGVSIDESLVHRIIHQEKPAFCTYNLSIQSR